MLTLFTIKFTPEISGITLLIELFAVFAFVKGWFEPSVYEFCWNVIDKLEGESRKWNIY